ncbi:hypothetical protein PC116_g17241 [Phytophthora cactorum]|uniref:Uncharacterized protein n=1 Tax=Phytophthora cactorum TaxID=29920 RepID=A0A8T1FPP8_9STRA|nr:hypothetical protein PC114_g9859 [Phytophthora cactorum]KAG2976776.1 hypothetical protein PC118_g13241 [Phytophthora cactorum]KAG4049301.1 hypothetical protein PC123_g15410 [Phytophthora cactorum]KAG4234592.1 hypothetical protein PC116_g17241 [Phytophthora cactorum]
MTGARAPPVKHDTKALAHLLGDGVAHTISDSVHLVLNFAEEEVSLDDPAQPVVHVGRHLVHEDEHLEGGQVSALELGVLPRHVSPIELRLHNNVEESGELLGRHAEIEE